MFARAGGRWPHAALLVAIGGCVAEVSEDLERPEREVATTSSAIAREVPGQADVAARVRMRDPDKLLASYATLAAYGTQGCSGTMVGPNMMLSAAHCDGGSATVTAGFKLYRDPNSNSTNHIEEFFTCDRVANTFIETDVALWWCRPNADGQHPGIKYGYLDYDLVYTSANLVDLSASRSRHFPGRQLYSFWWNPVDNLGTSHMLYSFGDIDAANTDLWSNPTAPDWTFPHADQCDQTDDLRTGVRVDMYSNPGCSGSALMAHGTGAAGRRIVVAPISTSAGEARIRDGQPIVEMLSRAYIATPTSSPCGMAVNWPPMVNNAFLSTRGLNAANFGGFLDANNNGVFELQESIERVDGERRRPSYWFDFGSQRSNLMWDVLPSAIRTQSDAAVLTADAAEWVFHADHPRLNLSPNTRYHVTFTAASDREVAVCLNDCAFVGPTPGGTGSYTQYAFILNSAANSSLQLWTRGNGTSFIGDVSLVEMGSTANFDTADARALWTAAPRVTNSNTPTFLPMGRRWFDSASLGDMAAMVSRGGYTLWSNHLPFESGTARICFDVRSNPLEPTSVGAGRVRVVEGTFTRTSMAFGVPADWTRMCTPWFHVSTANARLDFGLDAVNGIAGGTFLVDEVTFDRAESPSMRFAWDGPDPNMICKQVFEHADAAGTWLDNWICSDQELGIQWSEAGEIPGMRCRQVYEHSEPPHTTWGDNYICVPHSSPIFFEWSQAGPIAGKRCVQWKEPADPHTWNDNFLCY